MKKIMQMAFLAISVSVVAAQSYAQDVTLRVATGAPPNTIWQTQLDRFAADVDVETNGEVKLDIFYGSQLGNEQDTITQMLRGRIDMVLASTAGLANQLPEAYLPALPFYYDDVDVRSCILDTISSPYTDLLGTTGLQFIGWFEVGAGQLSGTEPLTSPQHIKGKRLAVTANKVSNMYWEMIGAIPVPTPSAEMAANMSTGLVDVVPSIPVYYVFAGINKVAPIWSKNNYINAPASLVMNQDTFKGLSEEHRAGIIRAINKIPADQIRKEFVDFETAVMNMHTEAGGTIVEANAEEMDAWRAFLPEYYSNVLKEMSADGQALFASMEAAKAQCSN